MYVLSSYLGEGDRLMPGPALLLLRRYGLPVICFVVIATGVLGFALEARECGSLSPEALIDALYRTLQTFGLNFDLPDCQKPGTNVLNLSLQIARFLAFLVAASAVISVFFTSTWNDLLLWLQIRLREENRLLLLGFGQTNRAIALASKRQDVTRPITAVDRTFDAADRRLARDLGIRLVEAELSDPQTINRIRPDRAQRIVVALGNDIRTIEVASAIAPIVENGIAAREIKAFSRTKDRPPGQTRLGEWLLAAHISDPALLANLTEARDLANRQEASFQPFNLRVEAAASFAFRADLVQRARDHRQDRVHLVIVGLGHQGEAILIETLLTTYAADLKPPRITVLDRDADGVEARLRATYPRLMEDTLSVLHGPDSPTCEGWVPIAFHNLDVEKTDFTRDYLLTTLDGPDATDCPTAWVFACGDDCRNQSAALRLEIAMQQRTRRAVPIFVRLWGSGLQQPTAGNRNIFGLVHYFGSAVDTVQNSPLLDPDHDTLARAIHAAYQAVDETSTTDPSLSSTNDRFRQNWLDLPESMRAANRRPARHLAFKFRDLGLDWPGFRAGKSATLAKDRVRDLRARIAAITDRARAARDAVEASLPSIPVFTPDDRLLYEAALIEHSFWSVERVCNGWMPSPTGVRNNIYRHQVHLRPFADLHPMPQCYDLVALDTGVAHACSQHPAASDRAVLRKSLTDSAPADLSAFTQVELWIDPAHLPDESRLEAWAHALRNWSRGRSSRATRLHLLLTAPVVLPADRSRGHPESLAIKSLSAVLLTLHPALVIDVTRLYPPMPLPAYSAAAAGFKAAT